MNTNIHEKRAKGNAHGVKWCSNELQNCRLTVITILKEAATQCSATVCLGKSIKNRFTACSFSFRLKGFWINQDYKPISTTSTIL